MFQNLRRLLSIDRIAGHRPPSNRTTPSRKRHINSLPTELLITVFQNYCGPRYDSRYGLISLTLVCRFWHAIITACPALWTSITFQRINGSFSTYAFNESTIACKTWPNLERALTRAGTATLSLGFYLRGKLGSNDEEERVLRLFGRCRDLGIILHTADEYTFASSIIMPHLEWLALTIIGNAHIEPLFDSIESSSILLRSLSFYGDFPANLAQREPLLQRLVKLDIHTSLSDNISFFSALRNLEELKIRSLDGEAIQFSPSDLPKLVSLYIRTTPLSLNQQPMLFPVLETLTLDGNWSNLQLITAPKLRNLILTYRDREESETITMSALRRSTVRPISLSTDFDSDTYLPKLLELWSSLSELHLRRWASDCIPGPITTAALAGSRSAAPLCSSLRYFTVHMKQGQKNKKLSNMSIRRLKRIVMKRKSYGVIGLQRVMCVWDWDSYWQTSEVEWVDVL